MKNTMNKCCSAFCGFLTFLAGLVYLLLIIGLMVYCYIVFATGNSPICKANVSLSAFVTITDILQITLLLTSGCLGMVGSKAQSGSVIESYLLVSTIAFFLSTIFAAQSAIEVYRLSSGDIEAILGSYNSVDVATGQISDLSVEAIFLVTNLVGMIFTLLSCLVACRPVCTRSPAVGPEPVTNVMAMRIR